MTANPLKPVKRYRPGKPISQEPSEDEDEDDEEYEEEVRKEQERERWRQEQALRRQELLQRQKKQAQAHPKATPFPAAAATEKIVTGVHGVRIEERDEEEGDEEGFVTEEEQEEEEEELQQATSGIRQAVPAARLPAPAANRMQEDEEGEDENESEDEDEDEEGSEESSSEGETPRRILLRPTFIKKDNRSSATGQSVANKAPVADSAAEAEARRSQRQEMADMLVREQLVKDATARSQANRAWDDDEVLEAGEEDAIDDTDDLDPEAEYAAWKLRELKRLRREREAIEAAEKEREEIERRRNLTAEEREREDHEFIDKQKEEKKAARGQTGFMQRYFHKGAFFRDELEREGLDKRKIMGSKFADDVSRETLPQYMQIRDMTKLGKKGRTRYKDLKSEDTGRFGEGLEFGSRPRGPRDRAPADITDERFLPDSTGERFREPTGANASAVGDRRRFSRSRSPQRRRFRSRSRSPRYDRYTPESGVRRKRSRSPYRDQDKRRRVEESVL